MGLFSKNKDEGKPELPPMPPAPPSAPVASAPAMSAPVAPNASASTDVGQLEVPSIPGTEHFDDIKSQVVSDSNGSTVSAPAEVEAPKMPEVPTPEVTSESSINSSNESSSDDVDSLFDLSGIDLPEMDSEADVEEKTVDSSFQSSSSSPMNFHDTSALSDSTIEHSESLNFVSRTQSRNNVEENIFVTTAQFKALLEIVESVKARVKESSETHLRLLDIKSEEDVEYENLRKSFQFIEDKLYEVDSLIFEK